MADPPKKFAGFGFSKVVKKSNLVVPPPVTKEKSNNVQFIECLESNIIKVKDCDDTNKVEAPLVIPIIGPRKSSTLSNGRSIAEIAEDFSDVGNEAAKETQEVVVGSVPPDSLDAIAAREILQEGADALKEAPASTLDTLPAADSAKLEELQRESTIEDYDNIPVNQFGLAMLRGMGWKPDEGIGKNKKLVPVTAPVVRPKGMGLGADKVMKAAAENKTSNNAKDEEELKMIKGAFVKIVAGMHRNQYGQVEGFSDDSGRVVVKLAIGGHVVSVNEASLFPVSKSEYSKNSKVLNAAIFEEFKKKEETGGNAVQIKKERQSPSSSRTSKTPSSNSDKYQMNLVKREKSSSPESKPRKENNYSRSKSRSPQRSDRKVSSNRRHRDRSESPQNYQSRRRSPANLNERKNTSSARRRSPSSSPQRNARHKSPKPRRSRSRSRSYNKDKYSTQKKGYSDSDSDSKSSKKKKKKKKHKERRRSYSRSSSEGNSRSRSRSPKKKSRGKKSRRSRSRSPKSRKH